MKKPSLTILSLLALSAPAFGQVASDLINTSPSGNGLFQFVQSGERSALSLCTYEIGRVDERGFLHVDFVAAGSASTVIAHASEADADKYLVFYPADQMGNPNERRVLRNRYLVMLSEGADLEAVKTRCGMQSIRLFREGSNIAICEESSAGRVLSQLTNVLSDPQVISAEPIFAKKRVKRLIPTDPFYAPNTLEATDTNYQWYLNNEGVNGGVANVDINVEGALDLATGNQVTVAVVDDGVAIDHVDLVGNAAGPHLNLFPGDGAADSPATFEPEANHGTAVAGLIAASFNNGEGISGVAPRATLSGIRLLPSNEDGADLVDDLSEAQALLFAPDEIDVYNNSWGPTDDTLDLDAPGPLALDALRNGVETGRMIGNEALGSIYVWAAGNGGEISDRSDYDGYANSKYTIAVGAVDDSGTQAVFSEEGSNLVVVAPSSGGAQSILTTSFGIGLDLNGTQIRTSQYVTDFGGTSAATPLVSGVVALMLEENRNLNWREVQDILIRSAFQIDPSDPDWITNAAGLTFNHKYGAGLVDATAAVTLAGANSDRVELGPVVEQPLLRVFSGREADLPNDSGIVPDNDGNSLLVTYDMTQDEDGNEFPNLRVEHVELRARVITQSRTDLEIVLISPNGTQSILHAVDEENTENSITNFTFMTVRNWGEGSAGDWVVRITDRITGNPAIFQNATLTINGVPDPDAPVEAVPILTSPAVLTVSQGEEINYLVESNGAVNVFVGDLPEGLTFDPLTNRISGSIADPGLFFFPIALTDSNNATGNFQVRVVVTPTAVALGDAIGLTGMPAFFGGDAPWDFEVIDTNSDGPGEDASSARSAIGLDNLQSSILGFNSLGRGVLMFDWKTSSEAGADRLWFNRGGDVPEVWDAFIDGIREWATTAVVLPNSSNDIRWIYAKDGDKSPAPNTAGEDRGLIDNVAFIEMDKFMSDLTDAGPIEGFIPEFDGRMIFYPMSFESASPAPGGSEGLVLASPAIGHGQTASMATWVEGPGVFNANVLLYSHPTDVFEFLVDGVVVEELQGFAGVSDDINLALIRHPIGIGRHRVQLRYRKDFSEEAFVNISGSPNVFEPFEGIVIDDLSYVPDMSFTAFLGSVGDLEDDGDGYSLFEEYAFGGDVRVADTPRYLPTFVEAGDGSFVEYGFDTSLTHLTYTAQQSTNLDDWTDVQSASVDRVEGDVAVYRVPVNASPSSPRLFFRVKVEER